MAATATVMPPCGAIRRALSRPGMPESEVTRTMTFSIILAAGTSLVVWSTIQGLVGQTSEFMLYSSFIFLASSVCLFIWLFRVRTVGNNFAVCVGLWAAVTVIVRDIDYMTFGSRTIATYYVLTLVFLSERLPRWYMVLHFTMFVVWIAVSESELAFRWGLLDMEGLSSPEDRKACCEYPPCAYDSWSDFATRLIGRLIVYAASYVLIAGTVETSESRREQLERAQKNVQALAESLVRFDLDAADAKLEMWEGHLDEAMVTTLKQIVENLKEYRPYLPPSLLKDTLPTDDDDHEQGPGKGIAVSPRASTATSSTAVTVVESVVSPTTQRSLCSGTPRFSGTLSGPMQTPAALAWGVSPASSSQIPTLPEGDDHDPALELTHMSSGNSLLKGRSPAAAPSTSDVSMSQQILRTERVSLVVLAFPLPAGLAFGNSQLYMNRQRDALTQVSSVVDAARGIVQNFRGDRIFANFNAFRRATNHQCRALMACVKVGEVWAAGGGRQVTSAVVSGRACVGVLGNTKMLAPAIIGDLPSLLAQVHSAAALLDINVVCDFNTFVNASLAVPLRVSLHTVLFSALADSETISGTSLTTILYAYEPDQRRSPGDGAGRGAPRGGARGQQMRSTSLGSMSSVPTTATNGSNADGSDGTGSQQTSMDVTSVVRLDDAESVVESIVSLPEPACSHDEWMYRLQSEPGKRWEMYNEIGMVYHKRGPQAAVEQVKLRAAGRKLETAFMNAMKAALTMDMHPQMTAGRRQVREANPLPL